MYLIISSSPYLFLFEVFVSTFFLFCVKWGITICKYHLSYYCDLRPVGRRLVEDLFAINYFQVWSPPQTSFTSCCQSLDLILILVLLRQMFDLPCSALQVFHVCKSCCSVTFAPTSCSWCRVELSTMIRVVLSLKVSCVHRRPDALAFSMCSWK